MISPFKGKNKAKHNAILINELTYKYCLTLTAKVLASLTPFIYCGQIINMRVVAWSRILKQHVLVLYFFNDCIQHTGCHSLFCETLYFHYYLSIIRIGHLMTRIKNISCSLALVINNLAIWLSIWVSDYEFTHKYAGIFLKPCTKLDTSTSLKSHLKVSFLYGLDSQKYVLCY